MVYLALLWDKPKLMSESKAPCAPWSFKPDSDDKPPEKRTSKYDAWTHREVVLRQSALPDIVGHVSQPAGVCPILSIDVSFFHPSDFCLMNS